MYTPVETVIAFEIVDRFFQVGPDQPDLHPGLLMGQCVGKREKNRSARRTVISANRSRLKESVIMTSDDKNPLNLPMMLCTGIGPRGVVATKLSDSICAPSLCRT